MLALVADLRRLAEMTLAVNVPTVPVPLGAPLRRSWVKLAPDELSRETPARATLNKRKKRKKRNP